MILIARFVYVPFTFVGFLERIPRGAVLVVPKRLWVARAALAVFASKAALLRQRHVIELHHERSQRDALRGASDQVHCTKFQFIAA